MLERQPDSWNWSQIQLSNILWRACIKQHRWRSFVSSSSSNHQRNNRSHRAMEICSHFLCLPLTQESAFGNPFESREKWWHGLFRMPRSNVGDGAQYVPIVRGWFRTQRRRGEKRGRPCGNMFSLIHHLEGAEVYWWRVLTIETNAKREGRAQKEHRESGGSISTGNRRVKCESISPREGLLLLSRGRGVWEQPPKGFYQTWVLYRNVSTGSFLESVFLLMGTAPAKIMKLIAREAAGSA